ncbi:MAG: HAMP domain-containing sensor histidine kinase [Pseudomonadota bacterium]
MSGTRGTLRPHRSRLLHPAVWISLSQAIWIAALVAWILYVVDRNDRLAELAAAVRVANFGKEWGSLVWGVALLVALFVTLIFISVALTRYWSENRAIHAFVSTVTHELRTPLAAIRLYMETLQTHDDLSPGEREEFNRIIMANVERLAVSIDAILEASRLERRGVSLDLHPLDLTDQVRLYLNRHELQLDRRGRRLELRATRAVTVLANAEALDTVLNNLVENALRYSPAEKSIEIAVTGERGRGVLTVRDQGRGIRPADIKSLFKMFARATNTTDVAGTGLGLFIVQGLVRAMHGDIHIRSEGPDRGAIVTVSFPEHIPARAE